MQRKHSPVQDRFSRHSRTRGAQRSIPRCATSLVETHGEESPSWGGARILRLSRQTIAELVAESAEARRLERKLRSVAVVGRDGRIITVYWPRR